MSNCFSLISCDGTCPNKHNISGTGIALLTPFLNTLVQVNNNKDCIYYVRDEKMVGFQIQDPKILCTKAVSRTRFTYSITSLVYNGRQYINTPITYSIVIGSGYQCLNCQTPEGAFCSSAIGNNYNNSNAHTLQINNILRQLNLDIQMFPFGNNGSSAFRIYDSDILEFKLSRIGFNVNEVYELFFDGTNLTVTFNGNNVTTNLVNESTYTCTEKSGRQTNINSVSGVSACTLTNTFADYLPVSECDFISIQPMGAFCLVTNTLGTVGATRTATLVVTGGTPPYSFLWENGNRTNTISNLPAGSYDVTITDYFGDFVLNTSCSLPSIVCSALTITTNITYTCLSDGVILLGQGKLSITTSGGFGPYTYSATINGVPNTLTNGLIVNHGDAIENIITTDTNGCTGSTEPIYINCPPSTPPPPPELTCEAQVACVTPPTFTFSINVTNSEGIYSFDFNLSSSYTDYLMGSYKIYDVDFQNSFLPPSLFDGTSITPQVNIQQSNIYNSVKKYHFNANGAPIVSLQNYVEFGFHELTPVTQTNNNSPWHIVYYPFEGQRPLPSWYTPVSTWVPGSTSIQIDIVLFTKNYCILSGTTNITIPLNNNSNTTTITF